MAYLPTPNQSVSGTVGSSIIGLPPVNLNVGGNPVTTSNPVPVQPPASGSLPVLVAGSVISVQQGSVATVIIGGSIAASFTPPANQSVSGTVGASIVGVRNNDGNIGVKLGSANRSLVDSEANAFPIFQDSEGQSATMQVRPMVFNGGTWDRLRGNSSIGTLVSTGQSSVITVGQSSMAVAIVSGSIAATFTPPANQSVSGTVGASVIGHAPVVIVGGSILTSSTPNQSVSGTVQTDVRGSVATVIIGGSIATATTNSSVMLLNSTNVIGSVMTLQGTNPWIITGSVQGSFSAGNSSVQVLNFPTNQSVSGRVETTQTGTVIASIVNVVPSSVIVGASIFGLAPVNVTNTNVNVSGSVAAWFQSTNASIITVGTPAANQSVSGTVQADIRGSVATVIIGGSIATTTGNSSVQVLNFPANQSVSGAVSVSNFPTTQNVSGSVAAFQAGTQITSLVSTVPSSVIVGTSIFGQLPGGTAVLGSVAVLQGTMPWTIGSVYGNISGSVAATITNTNLNVGGSVVAFQGAGWSGSVAATITNVPQASVHGTVKVFPASMVSGHGSVNGAASVQILAAPGAGLYNYVTDFTLSNTGATTTLVTFTDGDTSIIGRAIAPAGGGAIATGLTTPMRTMQTNKVVNISATSATSVLYAWIGGYRAP